MSNQVAEIISVQQRILDAKTLGAFGLLLNAQNFSHCRLMCGDVRMALENPTPNQHVFLENCSVSGSVMIVVRDEYGKEITTCTCTTIALLNLSQKEEVDMTLITLTERQQETLTPETRAFLEAGILDNSLTLTSRGKEEFMEFLFESQKAEFGAKMLAKVQAEKDARAAQQ